MTFTLPADPNVDARFLRYPPEDPLARAGVNHAAVGASGGE
jgi:hypothetical protein